MTRRAPTLPTLRALFARSRNQCAYPDCRHVLVDEDDVFVAQVCHIEAAAPNGPRFNPAQSDEERRATDNLILLCYAHHKKTHDVERFPVDVLRDMKAHHEKASRAEPYEPPEQVLEAVSQEWDAYWAEISRASRLVTGARPFPMAIDSLSIGEILGEITSSHEFLQDLFEAIEHEGAQACWDGYYIGVPNHFARLEILLAQLRVRHLEERSSANPASARLRKELREAQEELRRLANSACHVD